MCSSTFEDVQFDLPATENPFEPGELTTIKQGLDSGKIRRYGAALYHRRAGYTANAMVAWVVDSGLEEDFVRCVRRRSECTHAYKRKTHPEWPYNYYTMIHGSEKDECQDIVEDIADQLDLKEYKMLFSSRELKKTSLNVNEISSDTS